MFATRHGVPGPTGPADVVICFVESVPFGFNFHAYHSLRDPLRFRPQ